MTYQTNKNWIEFIELAEHCGKYVKKQPSDSLDGYHVLVVRSVLNTCTHHMENEIIFSMDLSGKKLHSDTHDTSSAHRFFAIGSTQNPRKSFSSTFSEAMHINSKSPAHKRSIPQLSQSPVAIILIFLNALKRRTQSTLEKLKLVPGVSTGADFHSKRIDAELENLISENIVDMFMYGTFFQAEEEINFRALYRKLPNDLSLFMSSAQSDSEPTHPMSFSRCGDSNSPFSPAAFQVSKETPGTMNECKAVKISYPFRTQHPLQSSSMKMVINLQSSLKAVASDPSILEGSPLEVTSKLLGVSERTVRRINNRAKENQLLTPKKRQRKFTVLSKIDKFDRDWIEKKITDSYKSNVAPDAKTIYQAFMIMKQEQYDREYETQLSTSSRVTRAAGSSPAKGKGSSTGNQANKVQSASTSQSNKGQRASTTQTPNRVQSASTSQSNKGQSVSTTQTPNRVQSASTSQSNKGQSVSTTQTPNRVQGGSTPVTTSQAGSSTPSRVQDRQTPPDTCPVPTVPEKEIFKCSIITFRRLLRLMGYRFKRIDNRAKVMQRPELTKWRGRYLKRLRKNDEETTPKKLVYLDEVSTKNTKFICVNLLTVTCRLGLTQIQG